MTDRGLLKASENINVRITQNTAVLSKFIRVLYISNNYSRSLYG